MIKIDKKNCQYFAELSHVLKARAKETIKPVFHHVYVERDAEEIRIICTDSKRMHILCRPVEDTREDFQAGYYEVVKDTKSEIILEYAGTDIGVFPNWQQVIPSGEAKEKQIELTKTTMGFGKIYATIIRMLEKNYVVTDYLYDCLLEYVTGTVKVFADNLPIVVDYGKYKAVIMPCIARD